MISDYCFIHPEISGDNFIEHHEWLLYLSFEEKERQREEYIQNKEIFKVMHFTEILVETIS